MPTTITAQTNPTKKNASKSTEPKAITASGMLCKLIKNEKAQVLTLSKKNNAKQAYVYELKQASYTGLWFVSALDQKQAKFVYIGLVRSKSGYDFEVGAKCKLASDDVRVKAFDFVWTGLMGKSKKGSAEVFWKTFNVFDGAQGVFGDHNAEARIFYTCKKCDHTYVVQTKNGEVPQGTCHKCDKKLKGKKLQASFSTKGHVCNASCIYAKGPVCTCGCGGLNHGKGHMH